MDNSKILDRLNEMEAHLQILQQSVTALKQGLKGSDAPKGPARKGVLPDSEKAKLRAQMMRTKLKKSNRDNS